METTQSKLPNIRPASDLRTNFTEVMTELHQSDKPVFLTKKGRCVAVIMKADDFSKYEGTLEERLKEYDKNRAKLERASKATRIRCDFCGMKSGESKRIVATQNANICNECAERCMELFSASIE